MSNKAILDHLVNTLIPQQDALPYFRGMLYGAEGSTKTITACSVGSRVLMIETDVEGYVSMFNHPEIYRKTTRMRYEGLSQIQTLADTINDPVWEDYDTVVIDTGSQMVSADLDVITKVRLDSKKIDEEVPDWPTYRLNQNKVRRAITALVANAHKHIIITSHARQEKDKSGIVRTTPDMPQAVRNDITRLCHLVGYLTADVVETEDGVVYQRRMQVHPTKLIVAKSKIGGLPVVIKNPNLGEIVDNWLKSGLSLVDESEPQPESQGVLGDVVVESEPESGLEI